MKNNSKIKFLRNDLNNFQVGIYLAILSILGITFRMFYCPFDIPIIADGLDYFSYGYKMSEIGNFPKDWEISNNAWAAFMSIFFTLFNGETFLENNSVQRILSVIFSTATIFPVFLLCNKFFNRKLSMVGASIFIFDPRIILNSTQGLIEPSYIFIGTIVLYLFLSKNKKLIYASFFLVGIFSLLRWEGLLLIFTMIPLFVIRFRHEKKIVVNLIIATSIFLISILPMTYINIQNTGSDGLFSPLIIYGPEYVDRYIIKQKIDDPSRLGIDESLENEENTVLIKKYISGEINKEEFEKKYYNSKPISENIIFTLMKNAIENTIKLTSWIMIPIFIWFLPPSSIIIFKNKLIEKWSYEKTIILFFMISLFIPALYAFSRDFNDTRYLYVLFPIFSMVSLIFIHKILEKISKKKLISILILLGIIISSILFLEITKSDHELEKERYNIAKFTVANADGVNLSSFTKYFTAAEIDNNWPNIPNPNLSGHVTPETMKFGIKESNVIEFIQNNKNNGLTHIIAEDMPDSIVFQDVYINSENYPFLEKIYDGNEEGMNSKVKIFKINFGKM